MNKKGYFLGQVADTLGWLILFIIVAVFFFLFMLSAGDIVYTIEEQESSTKDSTMLLTLLRTPLQSELTIADAIIAAKKGNPDPALENEIDTALNSIYGQAKKVCWGLWSLENRDQKVLLSIDCKGEKRLLFDQQVVLPASADELPVTIRLAVLGYRE